MKEQRNKRCEKMIKKQSTKWEHYKIMLRNNIVKALQKSSKENVGGMWEVKGG
jgi:hypothetical protein